MPLPPKRSTRKYKEWLERGRAEGELQQLQTSILDAVVARFDPRASEYRRVEDTLAAMTDRARLRELFRCVLRASSFEECASELLKDLSLGENETGRR